MSIHKKIEELQSQLDSLKAQEAKCKDEEIDWPNMIGRLVQVRDRDEEAWSRVLILDAYLEDEGFPFDIDDCTWKYAKLYQGPTRPNWIEWHGGKCPLKNGEEVLGQLRDGTLSARLNRWEHENNDRDIMRYTIIKP